MIIIRKYSLLLSLCIGTSLYSIDWQEELHLDWSVINLSDETFWSSLSFPADFKWGVASTAWDIEGTKSHDNFYVQNSFTFDKSGAQYDDGCDHWSRYQEDIDLLDNLGIDQYRFTVAWEKIEPNEGCIDTCAIDHYIDLCKELRNHNIEPVICLFHFKLPVWFYQQGGFETIENIQKFERFCLLMFERLSPYVATWITYNEPVAYIMEAYFNGNFPPYTEGFYYMRQAGRVLLTMLNAHVRLYSLFKSLQPEAQIGFVHMFHLLDSFNGNFIEKMVIKGGHHIIFDAVFEFFKTGYFNWLYLVQDYNPNASRSLDYIGVNYYTHDIIKTYNIIWHERGNFRNESVSACGYSIYPEGLYRSILKAQELNIPIYITENGIADRNDNMRNEFIKQHLFVLQKAMKDGIAIKGYTYWCFMDKYDYGLCAVDPVTNERTLRPSAQPFVNFLKNRNKNN